MVKDRGDLQIDNRPNLEQQLNDLTEALTVQKQYLDRHAIVMEKLIQAIKQLDITIKKEVSAGSRQSLIQLDDLIKLFLEYDINPRYYHGPEHKALKTTETKHTELTRRKPGHKSRE
jgi:hypothetical protein